jgi:large subunit GTPase 1
VKEVDRNKINFLLINKSDMLTVEQRLLWADYFQAQHINYAFWSAEMAKQYLEKTRAIEKTLANAHTTTSNSLSKNSDEDTTVDENADHLECLMNAVDQQLTLNEASSTFESQEVCNT